MKLVSKITLGLAVASSILFVGCHSADTTVSEESLGLRKTDLYTEKTITQGDKTSYSKSPAGSGHKIDRAFQDAPPMIPHDTEGMLPITINDNQCITCHMPEAAKSMGMGATPVPVSHFTNFRPKHKFDGQKFEKSIDNMKNEMSIKKEDKLQGARFNCSQCHAPQSTGVAVKSTFKAAYTHADGAKKSSWNGNTMTESLDTLGKDSKLTDADYANANSAAGSLTH